ncbi:bifunctional heptose 7-phosphate kinase/heptose 1-phosphate adenyltransferase, partial [Methanoregula sp.]|uniref:bifunctional heptose 7-phosphate kinase/heptose 1-phosphate adenyltransferase n=1 Tax=Methanoregula sp. TaxID=2052170 RepID=UPI003C71D8B5
IVDRFSETTVLVIGDLMLDRFIYGTVSRLSPEAPVPLVEETHETYRLGGAANAVANIHNLGGKVLVSGIVGNDWFGRQLIGLLKQDGIETAGVLECNERPTTVKSRVIAGKQHLLRLDREIRTPISADFENKILASVHAIIGSVDVILVSDYNKGVVTRSLLEGLIACAKKSDTPVIVYPKIGPSCDYLGVSVFIIPLENAVEMTGIKQINETSIRNMGQWLLTRLECDSILITRGREGLSLFDKNGDVTHLSKTPSSGETMTMDTIASVIALALPSGQNHVNADIVRLAAIGSSIASASREPGVISRKDLMDHIRE